MKKTATSKNRSSARLLFACLGALVSIIVLILRQSGVAFMTSTRFNTLSGICAILPIVFFVNRRFDEALLGSFSMLIAEIISIVVLRGGFSSGLGFVIYILLSTAIIAAIGLLSSMFLRKSTPHAVFIPIVFVLLVLGFAVRMLFYAKILLAESFNFSDYLRIITISLSTVLFWVFVSGLTVLAAILKGPVVELPEKEQKVEKYAPAKQEMRVKQDRKVSERKAEEVEEKPQKKKAAEQAEETEPKPATEKHDDYPDAVGGCKPAVAAKRYNAPDASLLEKYDIESSVGTGEKDEQADAIENCLKDYGVPVNYLQSVCGPSFTRYEFEVASGTQLNKVTSREKELSYSLCGKKIRILAPIPGKKAIGFEVPNDERATVGFGNAFEKLKDKSKFKSCSVPMILGMTIDGDYAFTDVAAMPHMVIAGTTGSGKSVCINSLLNSIIYTKSPEQVKLILVDPKYVEMGIYEGIPHLLLPVITDMDKVLPMLEWLITEMDRRYKVLSEYKVRDIKSMNNLIDKQKLNLEKLPFIVTVIDEVADLMASAGKDVDGAVSRLAAKARAVGIHLVLATQRPSADVITGTLKSNLPGRIAFAVSSGINSKIILDQQGAESLLGKGDMLFLDPAVGDLQRIQGVLITGEEVGEIVRYVEKKNPRK